MNRALLRKLVLMTWMCGAALAALALRPSHDQQNSTHQDLETLIPSQFGDWQEIKGGVGLIINPQQQQTLEEIYSQTLSRVYVNQTGDRIMLSIAYGGQQSKTLQVHRPETCYAAQGFEIHSLRKDSINLNQSSIPVMRLNTQLGSRVEPVSYWVRIGQKAVIGNFQQSLTRFNYGIHGTVPDGLLVRVSSISRDPALAFRTQDTFLIALYKSLGPEAQSFLIGAESRP